MKATEEILTRYEEVESIPEAGIYLMAQDLAGALRHEKERADSAERLYQRACLDLEAEKRTRNALQEEVVAQSKSRDFYEGALVHANDRSEKAEAVCKAFGDMKTEPSPRSELVVLKHTEFNKVKAAWTKWWVDHLMRIAADAEST